MGSLARHCIATLKRPNRPRNEQNSARGISKFTRLAVGTARTPRGNPIYLKAENLQPGGSFKIRGATYCLSLLTEGQLAAGVIAYSTGNHAQAVALASKQRGIHATIVMSPDVPNFKVEATQRYGATVLMAEASSKDKKVLTLTLMSGCMMSNERR